MQGSSIKIFLSYAHEQAKVAQEIAASLSNQSHDVFFDQSELMVGEEYNTKIRKAVEDADIFIFLISQESVQKGSYTLTELLFAKKKWPNPSRKVVPVVVGPILIQELDPYLRSITIYHPEGNIAAEVTAKIQEFVEPTISTTIDHSVNEAIHHERIKAYKGLWELTNVLPKWPRSKEVTYEKLSEFSHSLGDWYFGEGSGMFLSRESTTAYAVLQDGLTAVLCKKPSGLITDHHYDAIRELCSALRSQLVSDIGSRT